MKFYSNNLVIKLSVSDMIKSRRFYIDILGLTENTKYTINKNGKYGLYSYLHLDFVNKEDKAFSIGLFKDIEAPYKEKSLNGTVPSFIVADIEATLKFFQAEKVVIDKNKDGSIIITNKSDKGYTDKFFFFRDPDNNSLVIRQNMNKA